MTYEQIKYEEDERIATITLNRPEALECLDTRHDERSSGCTG